MRHLRLAIGILGLAGLALRLAEDVRLHRVRKRLARVSDETFLKTARSVNAFESSLARLALEKSTNDDVRAFADHVLEKEGEVTNDLIEIMDVNLVTEADFKPIYHGWVDDLQKANLDRFDQSLVDIGQTVYQGAVSVFEAYVRDDATGPLKDYAARNIPRLQARLSQLQGLDLSVPQPVMA
ncbi:DUF4142 domain-containing protein [Asticcacaulis machinosus]|uniref:DUF4142 domain-containing protein n=1 Tax=Asticcacaulis machinosus TaxID=2984211 RepID=A0ABT5HK53_9CAUL|nr:DUF4142 domain-containing protein [Asticcacaulis machinosus]MDC7676608.1 DUF4142 domain-containing protein [Asticcacaulis machinosus]